MSRTSTPSTEFISLFRTTLLRWSHQNGLRAVLALPPFAGLPASHIQAEPTPVLKVKRGRKTSPNITSWPGSGLHAKPNAFIACVVQGSADIGVGVTEAMLKDSDLGPALHNVHGLYQLRLSEREVLVQPSNVPTADGSKGHWFDPKQKQPDSSILWIDILAEGAMLHTCFSVNGEHILGPARFVFDARLMLVMEGVMEEIRRQMAEPATAETSRNIVNGLLHVLFLRIYRSLEEQQLHEVVGAEAIQLLEEGIATGTPELPEAQSYVVKKSCNFIQGHMNHRLTVERIANHTFVSPGQLNRLFRAELNKSVMEYVNEQRLARAKGLLVKTTMPINMICDTVGIKNTVYFSRQFREKTNLTPSEYRRRMR